MRPAGGGGVLYNNFSSRAPVKRRVLPVLPAPHLYAETPAADATRGERGAARQLHVVSRRRARGCAGAQCAWDAKSLVVDQGAAFGYSCLAPINATHMGLLWETNAEPCTADSSACLQVFSVVPLGEFD